MSSELIKIFNEYYHLYLNGINYTNNIDLIESFIDKSLTFIFLKKVSFQILFDDFDDFEKADSFLNKEYIKFNNKIVSILIFEENIIFEKNNEDYNLFKIYLGILINNIKEITYDINKNIFSEIFNTLHDGMFVCDKNFKILYNNNASRLFIEKILSNIIIDINNIYDIFPQLTEIIKNNEIYKNKHINYKYEKNNINMNFIIIINTILYCDVFYNIILITNNKGTHKSNNDSFISHELRNPLQTINFSNHLINLKNKDESLNKYLHIMSKSIYDMIKIVNDILDIDKIDNNTLNLSIENIKIIDLVERIQFEYKSYICNTDVDFNIDISENIPDTIFTDSTRLKQIIINLLINSVKYKKTNEKCVINMNINYNIINKFIEFIIIDNGKGIREDDFNMILRGQKYNNYRNNNSNGFGLYICNKIAHLLGGTIKIDTKYTNGSKFIFTHPIKLGDSNMIIQKNLENLNLYGEILICDNDSNITLLFSDIIENIKIKYNINNFYINICYDKYEIHNLLDLLKYDMIFIDIINITEINIIRIIRRKGYNGKIILMTSDINIKIDKVLFDDILLKPFCENDILNKIKNI